MWTLIITVTLLSAWDGSATSVSMLTEPGFASEEACKTAYSKWFSDNHRRIQGRRSIVYTCVQK